MRPCVPYPRHFVLPDDNGAMVPMQHKKCATQFEAMQCVLMNDVTDRALTQECINGMLNNFGIVRKPNIDPDLTDQGAVASLKAHNNLCYSAGFDVDDLCHVLQNANHTNNFIGISECATSPCHMACGDEAELVLNGLDKKL